MKFKLVESTTLTEKNDKYNDFDQKALIKELSSDLKTKPISNPTAITNALDKALKNVLTAYKMHKRPGADANVLLVGDAGVGKTAIVNQWCKSRGLVMVQKNASGIDKSDMSGIITTDVDKNGKKQVMRLNNNEFDALENPRAVLFLDEMNRADKDSLDGLLTLVLDHKIPDNDPDSTESMHKFNFLFTIAAVNPSGGAAYGTNDLDSAMLNRFSKVEVKADPKAWLNHFSEECDSAIAESLEDGEKEDAIMFANMKNMAETIVNSPLFHFSTAEEIEDASLEQRTTTSPRSLSAVIRYSEGDVDELLDGWAKLCDVKQLGNIEDALEDYEEIDDIANAALDYADELSKFEDKSNISDDDVYGSYGSSLIDGLEDLD